MYIKRNVTVRRVRVNRILYLYHYGAQILMIAVHNLPTPWPLLAWPLLQPP